MGHKAAATNWWISLPVVLILISWCLPQEVRAQHGRISGIVTEAEGNEGLPGANILLLGTTLGTSSDAKGRFHLTRVPTGTYTLQVRYLGYETATAEVSVGSGQTTTQNFSLRGQTLTGEEVTVWGIRARGQAQALTRQLNAVNITNVVAADQMGRFPDASAPEAVQRLPGIAITRDQGEGRYIQIRGGSAQMTAVMFNGESVPSPEGSVRQIALDAVPVDVLESIEVAKALTPDLDADAIGGAVNLISKRAPEGRVFNLEGAGGYGTIRSEYTGNGAFTWGSRSGNGKFGYLLNANYARRDFGSDDLEPLYEINAPGLADDALTELQVRHYTLTRARLGATANLDYRLNPQSLFHLTGIYSELQDDEQRLRFRHRVDKGVLQPDGSVTGGQLVLQHKSRRENLQTYNFTLGGDHLLNGGTRLEYHFTLARSSEDTPHDTEISFVQKKVTFRPDLSDPDNIQANPAPGAISGEYKFDGIEPASSLTRNRDYVGALNLSLPYRLGAQSTGTFKIGGKFRHKLKDQEVTESAFELADGAADIILGQGIGRSFSNDGFNPGDYPLPPQATTKDEVNDFVDRNRAQLSGGAVAEAEVNDYEVSEQTLAAYAMTEIRFTPKWTLVPGVRVERTQVASDGFAYDPDTEILSTAKNEKTYAELFPMIHLRYRLASRTNLRAAITRTLARPNFYDLVPYRLRDGEDLTVGNTRLDPTTALNYDLMFEHYDQFIGVISAGVFYKRLTDPIFLFTTSNDLGGVTTQPRNGESGSIKGVEVAVQQQLKFLPGVLNGLGIYGNYTFTDSEARLPGGHEGRLPGQADHVFNAALSYERRGFSGQLSLNYHDDFVDEFGGNVGQRDADVFVDTHLQLDFSASYRFSPPLTVFLELVNLTNEPLRLYQGTPDRPRQAEYYESWGRLGLRLNL